MKSCIRFHLPVLITVLVVMLAARVTAQTFTTLHTFTAQEGAGPNGLVLGTNTLYGTTQYGTNFSPGGTVFAIGTNGTGFTNLYVYSGGSDGYNLNGGLLLSSTNLFGTSQYGGTSGHGTVFAININVPDFTPLHSFSSDPNDGTYPQAGLTLSGNTFYGTSSGGGSGAGTVFAINSEGTGITNLHSFAGYNPYPFNNDGAEPSAKLILSGNTLYGAASHGGSSGSGTVFAINTNGTGFTNPYSFTLISGPFPQTNSDGAYPRAGLILSGNTLYGTAANGGSSAKGTVFRVNTNGTGFTNLHNFIGGTYGAYPSSDLILSGNTLYGTTFGITIGGGTSDRGTVFAINTDGTGFTTLYSFTEVPPFPGPYTNSDGANPISLILSDNTLYGTATAGGTSGNGTVFSIFLQPQLTIFAAAANVILTWPTNYAGFNLQSTTNLVSPVWTTNSPAPVVVNGQNTVTNPISGTRKFYRLSQ